MMSFGRGNPPPYFGTKISIISKRYIIIIVDIIMSLGTKQSFLTDLEHGSFHMCDP